MSDGKRGLSAPYGEHWRKWRKVSSISTQRLLIILSHRLEFVSEKLQHIGMNGKSALYYRDQQTLEAAILLREMLASASGLEQALQR